MDTNTPLLLAFRHNVLSTDDDKGDACTCSGYIVARDNAVNHG